MTIAVNEDGYREALGATEGMKEDKAGWVSSFQRLRSRGLAGVTYLLISAFQFANLILPFSLDSGNGAFLIGRRGSAAAKNAGS